MPSSLNGTGVTFNDGSTLQSGNIPAANLGSGTANANTVLRGNRTFGAPPAPTTAQVLSATAGAAVGAVGSYAFLRVTGTFAAANVTPGSTRSGSVLNFSNGAGGGTFGFPNKPNGTWRAMGHSNTGTGDTDSLAVTLFLRIS